ncbi:MAG TPA: HAD family phosphatase [Solirubrobacterales bacterium]|nr:HAD family phosphatase [Solirubrobacterales bacterium]
MRRSEAKPSRGAVEPPYVGAVIFDLDGVLVDSESVWDEARRRYVDVHGGTWREEATRDMMGMSSLEWSRYVRERLGVERPDEVISADVAGAVADLYRERLPLIPGAREAVDRIAERWPLGLASSSNREVIDLVLELSGLAARFAATVSSEEVSRGKPAPDVYVEAARRLDVAPDACAAIEDSHNGMLSASAAGMRVIAIPNRDFSPGEDALAVADAVLDSIEDLRPELVAALEQPQVDREDGGRRER